MPLDPVIVPLYPNVPYAPGVPPVLRSGTFLSPSLPAIGLGLVSPSARALQSVKQQWGIFTSAGQSAFDVDSVATLDIKFESSIPNYPIENGGFGSYNKVQMPYDARLLYTIGSGGIPRKNAFLSSVAAAKQSLTLFTVVMPEFSYRNANITHYEIVRRPDSGVGLLKVEVWLQEVRPVATSQFSSSDQSSQGPVAQPSSQAQQILFPKQPSGASPLFGGTVQAEPLSQVDNLNTYTPKFFNSPTTH